MTHDELRIGDAERDTTMAALREHYALGRLSHEELDERLDLVLAARTARDLAVVSADLPTEEPGNRTAYSDHPPWGPQTWGSPDGWRRAMHEHHRQALATRPGPHGPHRRGPRGPRGGRGPGPLGPVLLVALIIGLTVGWFTVLKVLLFVMVVGMVLGAIHRGSHSRRIRS